MATLYMSPASVIVQYLTNLGILAQGGTLNTYLGGTVSTPLTTYTDSTGQNPNPNPMTLSQAGRPATASGAPVAFWHASGVTLTLLVTDAAGNVLVFLPNMPAINDPGGSSSLQSLLANPAAGSGVDLVANAMKSYDIIADLKAAPVPSLVSGQTLTVSLQGGTLIGDLLGGLFFWNPTSTAADDGGITTLIPNAAPAQGRYIRITKEYFAAKGAPTTNATTTLAIDPDLQIQLPVAGTYLFEAWINDFTGAPGPGGLKGAMTFPSAALSQGYWGMNGNGTGVTAVATTGLANNPPASSQQMESAQNGVGNMVITGGLTTTAAGLLSFWWAEQTSNATASTVGQNSWLRVVRVK